MREILRNEATARKPLGGRISERFAHIGLDEELPELRGEATPSSQTLDCKT